MALVDDTLELFDKLERDYAPKLEAALTAAMDASMANISRTHLPAEIGPAERNAIARQLALLWRDAAEQSAELIIAHFSAQFKNLHRKATQDAAVLRVISEYIDGWGTSRASQVIRTTEQQVLSMVRGGMLQGEAQDTLFASIINKIPDIAKVRALIITRTEAHSAGQFASQKMAERAGVRLWKVWNSVNDERTRTFGLFGRMDEFNHRVMNGISIALEDSFRVPHRSGGFETLLFPGHPAGSAGNVINCRCVQTYETV